jgi:hypothetical protein
MSTNHLWNVAENIKAYIHGRSLRTRSRQVQLSTVSWPAIGIFFSLSLLNRALCGSVIFWFIVSRMYIVCMVPLAHWLIATGTLRFGLILHFLWHSIHLIVFLNIFFAALIFLLSFFYSLVFWYIPRNETWS